MGYLVYNDFSKQPQITLDFMVSSNHVYAFFLISLVGLIAFFKYNKNFIILYLISISILLEVFRKNLAKASTEVVWLQNLWFTQPWKRKHAWKWPFLREISQTFEVFKVFELFELFEYLIEKYSIFDLQLFVFELETLALSQLNRWSLIKSLPRN